MGSCGNGANKILRKILVLSDGIPLNVGINTKTGVCREIGGRKRFITFSTVGSPEDLVGREITYHVSDPTRLSGYFYGTPHDGHYVLQLEPPPNLASNVRGPYKVIGVLGVIERAGYG